MTDNEPQCMCVYCCLPKSRNDMHLYSATTGDGECTQCYQDNQAGIASLLDYLNRIDNPPLTSEE